MRITENTALSMQEIAVGGEDADYNNPVTFWEAWDHEEENERKKWREAIHKEITNMTKCQVWKMTKKNQIPTNQRLIGSKWVFENVDVKTAFYMVI